MKARTKAYLIFFLCFCLVLPTLVSCADSKGPSTNVDRPNNDYYDDSTRAKTKGNLPDDIDLDGETVYFFYFQPLELDVEGEDEETDIVYTAIYERNLKVEAWLNVDLNFEPTETTYWGDASGEISNKIFTNDGTMDAVIAASNTIIQNKLYFDFTDLNNTLYMELDQPWWNMNAIEEVSVDGRIFEFLCGDILLSSITNCGAIFYNKNLYENLNPKLGADYLYELVLDGTWTLDQFHYICNQTYLDRDGDQERSNNDIYAYQLFRYAEPIHYFANSAGVEYYKRNKAGFPEITINQPKAAEFTEKLYKLLYENKGANLYYPNQIGAEADHPHDFADGRILFNLTTLGAALGEYMRAMEDDYGILPYPKWDEDQDDYITMIANGAAFVCVPRTVVNGGYDRLDYIVSPTLEAMAIEAYRSVTETFYEFALKGAYTRDDVAADMIDMIVANSTKNFLYEYSSSLNGIGTLFSTCMSNHSTDFSSTYAGKYTAAKTLLDELISDYVKFFH